MVYTRGAVRGPIFVVAVKPQPLPTICHKARVPSKMLFCVTLAPSLGVAYP